MNIAKKILSYFGIDYNEEEYVNFQLKPFNYSAVAYLFIVLFSCFYIVDKEENATVRIFGKYSYTAGPGLNFKLPWPFAEQEKTQITKVKRIEVGFRTVQSGPTAKYEEVPQESMMLTGDDNIVMMSFIVQYRSYDARKWQFNVEDPDMLMRYLSEATMRLIVGKTPFDALATYGKQEVQQQAFDLLQELCDEINFGVKIVAVQLQDVDPPKQVVPAFKDVVNAKEEKEQKINEAEKYRNEILPVARGESEKLINTALGYAAREVEKATGKAKRWEQVRQEYASAKSLTRDRLVFEALQEFLPQSDITIDFSKNGPGLIKHLNIGQNN